MVRRGAAATALEEDANALAMLFGHYGDLSNERTQRGRELCARINDKNKHEGELTPNSIQEPLEKTG
jgi:hypothetical protein